jgi:hypothetical protein
VDRDLFSHHRLLLLQHHHAIFSHPSNLHSLTTPVGDITRLVAFCLHSRPSTKLLLLTNGKHCRRDHQDTRDHAKRRKKEQNPCLYDDRTEFSTKTKRNARRLNRNFNHQDIESGNIARNPNIARNTDTRDRGWNHDRQLPIDCSQSCTTRLDPIFYDTINQNATFIHLPAPQQLPLPCNSHPTSNHLCRRRRRIPQRPHRPLLYAPRLRLSLRASLRCPRRLHTSCH